MKTITLTVTGNGSIQGTLGVTGNLDVSGTITGNVAGTINPSFTLGSVPFQGASGLAQDNANFFWDDTTNRLGIGDNTPDFALDVAGTLGVDGAATFGSTLAVTTSVATPSLITASGALGITPAAGSNLNINLSTTGDFAVNTNQLYVDTSAGNIGIGTASPEQALHIQSSAPILLLEANDLSTNYSSTLRLTGEGLDSWIGGYMQYDSASNRVVIGTHSTIDKLIASDLEALEIDRASGALGLLDSSPDYFLELHNATTTPSFALSDDDVLHGVTTLAQTDVFFHLSSISTTFS